MEENMQDKLIKLSQAESQVISLYHDLNGAILGEMRKTLDSIKDEDFDQRTGFEYAQKLKKLQMDQSTLFDNVSMFLDNLGRDLDQSSYLSFTEDNFDEDLDLPTEAEDEPAEDFSNNINDLPFEDETFAPDDAPKFDNGDEPDEPGDIDTLFGDEDSDLN